MFTCSNRKHSRNTERENKNQQRSRWKRIERRSKEKNARRKRRKYGPKLAENQTINKIIIIDWIHEHDIFFFYHFWLFVVYFFHCLHSIVMLVVHVFIILFLFQRFIQIFLESEWKKRNLPYALKKVYIKCDVKIRSSLLLFWRNPFPTKKNWFLKMEKTALFPTK